MPDPDFSVSDVKLFVGSRRMIDVMDVTTQKGIEMSMGQWRRYYETPPSQREKLYNVISLEFSHTKLENLVKRPASVDVIDWVDNMWPRHLKERQRDSTNSIIDMQYPKVQKYCLMSVEGSFTDFHIDFGGTSVWYHILRGGKVFWLIPPTPQNLELYENWVLSGKQGDIFLGDKASQCQRIELKQGYTFMIPSGWIHAVYTPVDTLVFGGNFLHSFNIPMQLNIYSIEDRTRVPAKFRYPFYYEMCWYVLERYLYCLTNVSHLTPEFQKQSLGIGLKREDFHQEQEPNGQTKEKEEEEEEEEGEEKDQEDNKEKEEEEEVKKEEVKEEEEDEEEASASPAGKLGVKVHLTPLELEGLWHLLNKLEELPTHKKCVPSGIRNAPALLSDIRTLLEEHADDDPGLSYTGKPIVKWPRRPSWYRPPTPPPALVYRPRPPGAAAKLSGPRAPRRPAEALRRRRVRCKRCEACLRSECGDCIFCRDMKKFGGPGRLKQSCLLRHCHTPGLPNSAVCTVCGEGNPDGENSTPTLMECSACAKITHPECLKEPREGVINMDLPSYWKCPRCIQEKKTESGNSSSDDDEDKSSAVLGARVSASVPPAKHAHREGIGVREGRRGRRPLTPSRRLPPPSQRLLLQQQQNRKRAGALELQLRKRIKLERNKILQSPSSLSLSPKLLRQRSAERGGGDKTGLGRGASRGRGASALQIPTLTPVGRGRGRGVRLRGGGRGGGGGGGAERGSGEMQRGRVERDDTADDSEDEEDEEEERKENRPQQQRARRGKEQTQEEDEEEEEEDDNEDDSEEGEQKNGGGERDDGEEEEEEEEEEDEEEEGSRPGPPSAAVLLGDEARNQNSCLTVKLQQVSRGHRDPNAIVPKLEAAMTPRSPPSVQRASLLRPPLRNGASHASPHPATPAPRSARPEKPLSSGPGRTAGRGSRVHWQTNAHSSSSSSSSLHSSLQLSARDGGSGPGFEKEVWVSVFRYLSQAELCVCMAVCKSWYKWGCDKRLWVKIDLNRCRSLSAQALSGIIKRQPVSLDLSWTAISKKQLTWLINRLPGLKDLVLSGCSWMCLSALSSTTCPLLRSLDLRWTEGIRDAQIRELLSPPGSENRTQLRNLQVLRLCGLEISEATLRLIIRHMPQLTRLELSHSPLTDQALNLLTAVGSSTRDTLTHLNLAGCSKLSDRCLAYLKRLSCLRLLDLRNSKGVSRQACETFISELFVNANALYCLSDDKLIQRIS
ncbi:lysine-specific demethylase 2A-like isoform X2 [Clupea harengus]|uniref:[histone H3]-dimethyl-L-lysine(36) demethylase n=1 Tax=Clupea harengus TaxID=7950 RepID=A0A6P8ENQ1_CLUHA|nr:lysine-specific demethylase 2A-like isoform X2 [Clupea harengus]